MTADTAFPTAEAAPARAQPETVRDVVAALVTLAVLAVAGVVAGFVWAQLSPPRPPAQILSGGRYIPDETEAFIAGDGRYLIITVVIGLVAALAAWFLRPANRGVAVAAGLVVGSLVGATSTAWIGNVAGGGSLTGRVVPLADGQTIRLTKHLPLTLHTYGLVVVQAAVAVAVYGLFVAFAVHDDLNRPDPVRARVLWRRAGRPGPNDPLPYGPTGFGATSVDAGGHTQHGGGYGDAAGPAQQGDLPAQ